MDLEEERQRNSRLEKIAPHPMSPEETEWETKKAIDDYKFKLQKSEQDINTLQTNVSTCFPVVITASSHLICLLSNYQQDDILLKYSLGGSLRFTSYTFQNSSRNGREVRRRIENRTKKDAKRGISHIFQRRHYIFLLII